MLSIKQAQLKEDIKIATANFRRAVEEGDKEFIQKLHRHSKACQPENAAKAAKLLDKYKGYLIEPNQIDVNKIKPVLINVSEDKKWADLFVLARHTWSMPYNKGFGRRLRYVVFDEHHGALMGIIGLQSPPADMACRDDLFDYPNDKKLDLVNQTLDVFSLGSVPPYSKLLGGKLVAGLAASSQVASDYAEKYADTKTRISKNNLNNRLVGLTTTSAFGRSSIYNRLKFDGRLIAEPIGYTKGFGSIHLEALYPSMIDMLKEQGEHKKSGFGNGPKQKWQTISRAISTLGLRKDNLKHGLARQVFLYRLVENLEAGMSGGAFGEDRLINIDSYSDYWLERWALPRIKRRPDWLDTKTYQYFLENIRGE